MPKAAHLERLGYRAYNVEVAGRGENGIDDVKSLLMCGC